jgi:hypothetical protein
MTQGLSTVTQYRDSWYSLAPPWLTTGNAEKYIYTLQLCTDLLLDKMNQAIKIRLPGQGDASQLPFLAHDRALVQGPGESDAAFIERLIAAFAAWGLAGSRVAVLAELQAYIQNLQPGVAGALPELAIVGGYYAGSGESVATWDTLYNDTSIGAPPAHAIIQPSNFNWDGKSQSWRTWLIMYMALVATGQSGTSAATSTATGGSYANPGHNVSGVWVPATSGTPVNAPFMTVTGLSGMTSANVGQWLTTSGSAHAGNNGTFPITAYVSATSVVIANPNGVASDAGPIVWSVGEYPFIGPGPVWGAPGIVFGQGELAVSPVDTGANVGGIWQPTTISGTTSSPIYSWGLDVAATLIEQIRSLVMQWKSAGTYYHDIIVAFDGGTGAAGSAYSPNSSPGSGNPDGTFGGHGKNVGGVWVPNRLISSEFDCYCQGTQSWHACSVPNVT